MTATPRRIPLDFPDAPNVGDIFTATSGVRYQWDGTVWIVGPPLVPPIFVETDPLSVKLVGDTMTGQLHLPLVVPVADTEAVTKRYVDQLVTAIVNIAFYIGASDASTADCQTNFTAFSGFTDGPLPAANTVATGQHVIVAVTGTPTTGPMAGITLIAGDWIISDNVQWYVLPFGGQAANVAQAIAVTPPVAGGDDVQEVLTNLQAQKVAKAGDVMTGGLGFGSVAQTTMNDVSRHLALYGTTFGFNITSGQLNAIVPQANMFTVRCGANQRMSVADGMIGLNTNITAQGTSSFSGTADFNSTVNIRGGTSHISNWLRMQGNGANIYFDMVNNNNGTTTPVLQYRRNDGGSMGEINAYQQGYNIRSEALQQFYNSNGGWGWVRYAYANVASGGQWYVNGNMSAASVTNRSSREIKNSIREALPQEVTSSWDRLVPVRFRLNDPPPPVDENGDLLENPAPHPPQPLKWGFIAEDMPSEVQMMEAGSSDPVAVRNAKVEGYDIAAVLALAVAKIKQLEDQVLSLEARLA